MGIQPWWKRVRDEVDRQGWSIVEFERRTGIDRGRLYKYVTGEVSQPRGDAFERMAKSLNVNEWWLRTGEGARSSRLPLAGHVNGDATVLLQGQLTSLRPDAYLDFELSSGDHFALEVKGREMGPVYREGDLIICCKLETWVGFASSGDCKPRDCVVALDEQKLFLRYVLPGTRDGAVKLRAFNPDIPDRDDVVPRWVAPVVWIRRKL